MPVALDLPAQRQEASLEGIHMGIIALLVIGAIAGFIASRLVPGDEGYGWLGGLIAGIVGAFVGGALLGALTGTDWTTGINIPSLFAAIVGAIIVVFLWQTLTRRRGTA
jgi:uncharacterized membrane protein YeaQ/YmgE (transglycosylase-associated protein family)